MLKIVLGKLLNDFKKWAGLQVYNAYNSINTYANRLAKQYKLSPVQQMLTGGNAREI